MKKKLLVLSILILTIALVFSFVACKDSGQLDKGGTPLDTSGSAQSEEENKGTSYVSPTVYLTKENILKALNDSKKYAYYWTETVSGVNTSYSYSINDDSIYVTEQIIENGYIIVNETYYDAENDEYYTRNLTPYIGSEFWSLIPGDDGTLLVDPIDFSSVAASAITKVSGEDNKYTFKGVINIELGEANYTIEVLGESAFDLIEVKGEYSRTYSYTLVGGNDLGGTGFPIKDADAVNIHQMYGIIKSLIDIDNSDFTATYSDTDYDYEYKKSGGDAQLTVYEKDYPTPITAAGESGITAVITDAIGILGDYINGESGVTSGGYEFNGFNLSKASGTSWKFKDVGGNEFRMDFTLGQNIQPSLRITYTPTGGSESVTITINSIGLTHFAFQ